MKAVMAAALIAAGIAAGEPAEAASLRYDLLAVCLADCAEAGLGPDGEISGSITLDSAFYAPGGTFGLSALEDFEIEFGDSQLTLGSTFGTGIDLEVAWGANSGSLTKLSLRAADSNSSGFLAPGIEMTQMSGFASTSSFCSSASSCSNLIFTSAASTTGFNVTTASPAPIPAPPALALLASGAAALVLAGRRRRAAGHA